MSGTRDVFHGGYLIVAGVARFSDRHVLGAACCHDCEHDVFCDLDGVSAGGTVEAVSDGRPTNAHRERLENAMSTHAQRATRCDENWVCAACLITLFLCFPSSPPRSLVAPARHSCRLPKGCFLEPKSVLQTEGRVASCDCVCTKKHTQCIVHTPSPRHHAIPMSLHLRLLNYTFSFFRHASTRSPEMP